MQESIDNVKICGKNNLQTTKTTHAKIWGENNMWNTIGAQKPYLPTTAENQPYCMRYNLHQRRTNIRNNQNRDNTKSKQKNTENKERLTLLSEDTPTPSTKTIAPLFFPNLSPHSVLIPRWNINCSGTLPGCNLFF